MTITKEELEKMGLTPENADKVMGSYTKAISDEQQKMATEKLRADNAVESLKTANAKLEGYDPDWKNTVETANQDAQKKIDDLKFSYAVEGALNTAKAKNTTAVKALLNIDGLKLNGDEVVGLKEQLDKIKTDNDYLFEAEPQKRPFMGSTNGSGSKETNSKDEANAAFRAVFGKE